MFVCDNSIVYANMSTSQKVMYVISDEILELDQVAVLNKYVHFVRNFTLWLSPLVTRRVPYVRHDLF